MSDIAKAEAFSAVDGVAYQDAGVVSRTIIKNKAGSVTLFAFDEGEELSEHSAPYDALAHVLDGQVDIIIMPANVPHAVKAVSRFKMCLTMVRG